MKKIFVTYYEIKINKFAYSLINPKDNVKINVGIFSSISIMIEHCKILCKGLDLEVECYNKGIFDSNINLIAFM